jgi:hypothetical protein
MMLGEKWARPLDTTWYVTTACDSAGLAAELEWMLGDEDGLVIQELADDAMLNNTALRWFRNKAEPTARAVEGVQGEPAANVLPFATAEARSPSGHAEAA